MKYFINVVLIFIFIFGNCCPSFAFRLNGSGAYTNYALNNARYYQQRRMFNNPYNRNRYIYTPQQARYNGYRTGIYGTGYNNKYYYNRYRR